MSADPDFYFEEVTPVLSVIDLERAILWYERVLGFSLAWTSGEPRAVASVCRGQAKLNLGTRGALGPAGPSQIYLRVSPVASVWKHVLETAAEVVSPLAERSYGMRDF